MIKFKVGDRVVATRTNEWHNAGDTGTVTLSAGSLRVQFDAPCKLEHGHWFVLSSEINLEKSPNDEE